ncbi:hypothetical protein RHGRI_035578 [Rhododendron griersonianum]|uniref:Pectinesterase inhibitor domain-containing protein n=1 Tax=Rhododendron griersonianum TaxID=479676 RepID=A0AAV6HN67_9ERIC|nr:hypothetical protein RHGRI_035578 [Rhododendron griersonianum]
MPRNSLFLLLIWLLVWLPLLYHSVSGHDAYVRDACSVTRYQNLCVHSLAPFSIVAKQSPSKWARAGVAVTITEAKSVSQFLVDLNRNRTMRGRNRGALLDCVECLSDAIDNLHGALGVLRNLSGTTFEEQMEDVTTWLSAAMTDQGTCLDGFEGGKGTQVELLRNKVSGVTYVTSNALALVIKLATAGPESLMEP